VTAGAEEGTAGSCLTVEYFFYGRGRPGTEALADALAEAHWSFMDGYAAAMIARGPTLTPDRSRWTGSMHMGRRLDHLEREIDALDQGRLAGQIINAEFLARGSLLFCRLRRLEPSGRTRRR
jgi:hypothetical protein